MADEFSGSEARVVVPSKKVTLPVGRGEFAGVPATVAVNVRDWPVVAGFAEEARLVAEAARAGAFTTCVRTVEVDAA